jgi:NADH-quinone oxidoreductase subunit A
MLDTYVPIAVAIVIGVLFSLLFVLLSVKFGPHRPTPTKTSVYECGMPPVGGTGHRFSVKFYLVAVLFLLFDLEAVFLFPWAVTYKDLVTSGFAVLAFTEMALFLGVLLLGWYYCLRRGAFEWD